MMRYIIVLLASLVTTLFAEIDYDLIKTMTKYSGHQTQLKSDALPIPKGHTEIKKVLKEHEQEKRQKKQSEYALLYFFSESVSTSSFSSFLNQAAKYNQTHSTTFSSSQCLIGINGKLKNYIIDTREKLESSSLKKEAISLIDIRMTPEMFENYNITTVPAIALAKCPQSKHPSECTLLSVARGDVTLEYFLEKLKENNLYPQELEE